MAALRLLQMTQLQEVEEAVEAGLSCFPRPGTRIIHFLIYTAYAPVVHSPVNTACAIAVHLLG